LDRIDIHIEVPWVDYDKLSDERLGDFRSLYHHAGRRRRFASNPYTALRALPRLRKSVPFASSVVVVSGFL
jgi:hypothetical protein